MHEMLNSKDFFTNGIVERIIKLHGTTPKRYKGSFVDALYIYTGESKTSFDKHCIALHQLCEASIYMVNYLHREKLSVNLINYILAYAVYRFLDGKEDYSDYFRGDEFPLSASDQQKIISALDKCYAYIAYIICSLYMFNLLNFKFIKGLEIVCICGEEGLWDGDIIYDRIRNALKEELN